MVVDAARPHRIAVVGLGKIARDQHLPAIRANPALALVGGVDPRGAAGLDCPAYPNLGALLAAHPDLDAVALCTPPQSRHALAGEALAAGLAVLLEKPTAASLSEVVDLEARAARAGRTLFATWHSRHNDAVAQAARLLEGSRIARLAITWKEDVRRWHPGQDWIWEPGGLGVFDPGINALSILTRIVREPVFVAAAELTLPQNRQTPIAARLTFGGGAAGNAEFDWRQTGPQTWEIAIETAEGRRLLLAEGGRRLTVDGVEVASHANGEYADVYRRFDALIRAGQSDVDVAPLRLVADAFLLGRRVETDVFMW